MFTQNNAFGIEIAGFLKGYAEGPIGIGALLIITLVLIVKWERRSH